MPELNIIEHKNSIPDSSSDFALEFFGYNISTSGKVKKEYIKVPNTQRVYQDKQIDLDATKLTLISKALDSKFISCFQSDRYSLFDICFRDSSFCNGIGFNFVDIKDSTYIDPQEAFSPFVDIGINPMISLATIIQKLMFSQLPSYNPISMIGVVFKDTTITSIKSYIRFNQEDAPTTENRKHIINRIVRYISNRESSVDYFLEITTRLENIGFVFYFVGLDYNFNGSKRYKLYFRFLGKHDLLNVINEIESLLSLCGLQDNIEDVFLSHTNGIWGLAISTELFESVNGIQLYLYP